ncbi:MAG TPA: RpiB/LacA/LacB family sugar-phosphate isomerase [Phycisphaerae bacterium]|nr:RpiB/LacA/LacB family sugar-phosphate isomerase [Phycisphaerae bacterium]HRY67764.1 RpiB/LacA/LacB family sugar-phosphate isomerase [Phycisphaerae bacterium]HSA25216.1 RpiB/LacA/LacB family sugar-phosphate isomerase [Phycisphaerae bacterium]
MRRPVVTATTLSDLLKEGTAITLQKGSLLTPAARDWLKDHAVPVTWTDCPVEKHSLGVVMEPKLPEIRAVRTMLDRAGGLSEIIEPAAGRGGLSAATRRLCGMVSRKQVAKGVVLAQDGAVPVCVANKHTGIRAALGVNVPMVEEACRELGINVLVLEYPAQTPYQMRQMIERFLAGPTAAQVEIGAIISDLEQGGGRADW